MGFIGWVQRVRWNQLARASWTKKAIRWFNSFTACRHTHTILSAFNVLEWYKVKIFNWICMWADRIRMIVRQASATDVEKPQCVPHLVYLWTFYTIKWQHAQCAKLFCLFLVGQTDRKRHIPSSILGIPYQAAPAFIPSNTNKKCISSSPHESKLKISGALALIRVCICNGSGGLHTIHSRCVLAFSFACSKRISFGCFVSSRLLFIKTKEARESITLEFTFVFTQINSRWGLEPTWHHRLWTNESDQQY